MQTSWNDDTSTTSASGVRFRGVEKWEPDVAGSERGATRAVEHGGDQRRHRRLPVRPGDGDHELSPSRRQLGGEIDLGPDGDAGLPRSHERRVPERHAGTRHDDVGAAHELGETSRGRVLDEGSAHSGGGRYPVAVRVLAGRTVLDHGDVVAGGGAVTHHGVTSHTQPEHENATQSITPGMRMKSA